MVKSMLLIFYKLYIFILDHKDSVIIQSLFPGNGVSYNWTQKKRLFTTMARRIIQSHFRHSYALSILDLTFHSIAERHYGCYM